MCAEASLSKMKTDVHSLPRSRANSVRNVKRLVPMSVMSPIPQGWRSYVSTRHCAAYGGGSFSVITQWASLG